MWVCGFNGIRTLWPSAILEISCAPLCKRSIREAGKELLPFVHPCLPLGFQAIHIPARRSAAGNRGRQGDPRSPRERSEMTIASVLAKKGTRVVTATPEQSVREAVALLVDHNIGAVLVVDAEGKPVGMLSERDIVVLDDERKAAMVSNLLVVLCSDKETQPIINTGTLYG